MPTSTSIRISYDIQVDPYSPAEMAGRARNVGVNKPNLDSINTFALKIPSIVPPITAFGASGFEHGVASTSFIAMAESKG